MSDTARQRALLELADQDALSNEEFNELCDGVRDLLDRVDKLEAEERALKREIEAAETARDVLRARVEALTEALEALVKLRDTHYEVYGYEKQHYLIDENAQWTRARKALAVVVPVEKQPQQEES